MSWQLSSTTGQKKKPEAMFRIFCQMQRDRLLNATLLVASTSSRVGAPAVALVFNHHMPVGAI